MKIAIEFDLTARATIVHWPWGSHSFPFGDVGTHDMAEALQNFAIESSRRTIPKVCTGGDLLALRNAVESSPKQPIRYTENGKKALPSLDELFGPAFELEL